MAVQERIVFSLCINVKKKTLKNKKNLTAEIWLLSIIVLLKACFHHYRPVYSYSKRKK